MGLKMDLKVLQRGGGGLKISFGSYHVTTMVEERLIDLIEVIYWMYYCWEKFNLVLWKYFHKIGDGFEGDPKGLKIGLGSHPRA